MRIAAERIRAGRPAKSLLLVGLRGVGKTVLLDRMRRDAEAAGLHTLHVEAPEGRSLPAMLAPQLRRALLRLSAVEKAAEFGRRGLRALAGFARALKVKYQDIEVGFDFDPEPGLADNGDLEQDLQTLLEAAGEAARAALEVPTARQGVAFEPAALERMVRETRGYPYFLQEWGKHVWDLATRSPVTAEDVTKATPQVKAALDESFFRLRFDRLTPTEKRYLRAMAELGEGTHRSGDIAAELGRKVTALGPTRNQLIAEGMVWSPSHGDSAFTVPMFDQFMKRIMPGRDWRPAA